MPTPALPPAVPGGPTLGIDVMAYEAPCERCGFSFWWVFGLIPSYRPRPEEFTSTDFEAAVEVARTILEHRDGDTADVARQLRTRTAEHKARSHHPNRCASCGQQADWYALEGIITAAYHGDEIRSAYGRVPVKQWRAIRGRGQGIAWPLRG